MGPILLDVMGPTDTISKEVRNVACYHPLKGFVTGKTKNDKDKLTITSGKVDHLEWNGILNRWERIESKELKNPRAFKLRPLYDIPCGHCIGCRLEYSKQWALRCCKELERHESSYFITLTYDDEHVKFVSGTEPETGMIVQTPTLIKRDWQLFMKRLRRAYAEKYDNKLSFFSCGEYGDTSFRPHYHAIIFGLKIDDLRFYKRVGDYNYYTSEWLSSIWSVPGSKPNEPYGFVVVAEACFETAAYTARYITKKLNGIDAEKYKMLNIQPEFALMSRRPAIGAEYIEENYKKMFDEKYIYLKTSKGGLKFTYPKYYKRKFDEFFENEDLIGYTNYKYNKSEEAYRQMQSIKKLQEQQSDLSYLDLLSVMESEKVAKMKGLERRL